MRAAAWRAIGPAWIAIAACVPIRGQGPAAGGPLSRWVFAPAHVEGRTVKDLAGRADATIIGPVRLRDRPASLVLEGGETHVRVRDDLGSAPLPVEAMTAEAWVAVRTPQEWGGIVGAFQDNGGFEKGWVLGLRGDRFSFALSSMGADDGDGRMTYLAAASRFEPGRIHHVAGTYDGAAMRIYIDGALSASTGAQSGRINYPAKAVYEIGAYHDDDEFFPLEGDLLRIRVYDRALAAEEVRAHFESERPALPPPLRLARPPHIRHVAAGEVLIAWEAEAPGPAALAYGRTWALEKRIDVPESTAAHRVHLRGLAPEAVYFFRIAARGAEGMERLSEILSFDAYSDLEPSVRPRGPSPYPDDGSAALYARAAETIVTLAGSGRGWCLDLGCGDGRLAYEIAKRTDLRIVGVEPDPGRAAAARECLDRAGLYGVRVSVHRLPLTELPYTPYMANLIVSGRTVLSGRLPGDAAGVFRLLRPSGGVAVLGRPRGAELRLTRAELERWCRGAPGAGWSIREEDGLWAMARRGPLPGSGDWTHLYADPANTACSGDRLRAPFSLGWFGRPGPRNMIDRHHRAMAALVRDGRIFVHGNDRILAVDAYNGTMLWDVGIPHARRVAAARDGGHMAAAEDVVYVAAGPWCLGLEVGSGEPTLAFRAPSAGEGAPRDWGIVACVGDLLVGTAQKGGASRTGHSRAAILDGTYYDARPVATGDAIFAIDRHTGGRRWLHRRAGGGAILNSAVAIGGGLVAFVESRAPRALADPDGRIPLEILLASGHASLVALELATGRTRWARPLDLAAIRHVLHLCYARGILVAVGSRNEAGHPRYDLAAFQARNGRLLWSNHYLRADKGTNGDHGEQDQHPVIVGDTVYSRPCAFDLRTGERRDFDLDRGGHGCGAITASASYLFGRGGNPRIYPIDAGGRENAPLTRATRPGCWIHIFPAGGLVLIPEGSSGCTCGYPLQTSLGLVPRDAAGP